MGIVKRCGLFGLLFVVSSIVSFIGFSGNVGASSVYDDLFDVRPEPTNWHLMTGENRYDFSEPIWTEIRNAENYNSNNQALVQFVNDLQFRLTDGSDRNIYFYFSPNNTQLTIRLYDDPNKNWEFGLRPNNNAPALVTDDLSNADFRQLVIQYSPFYQNLQLGSSLVSSNSQNFIEPTQGWYYYYINIRIDEYPDGYEGEILDGQEDYESAISDWTPDIKLLQGSDWLVELSDYNFFTFDKVAFTCGEHDLAPIINWEVWDITDDENRELIDTLIFGAPALVKYQAPKVQLDKRYEIVAYYSDCEGYTFAEASTKQFTVRKDGTLNPTDYMNVCIMETFPFINIPDCMAEINDLLVVLSFRVPDVNDLGNPGGGGGGQGWAGLVDGCRQLQVLDDWILSPDVVVCPQMPSSIRNVVTPIVTFAMALGVITFVVQRQGMRGISG